MSSTPKQNPSLHAMTQGFSQVLSEQASQWPMTPGGPVAAALSLGSEDHGTLRQEWLEGQAELWQAMLEQAVARAGQKVAASPRDDQSFDDPMRGQNDMSDYLRQTRRINADYLKNMAGMAPSPLAPSDFPASNREPRESNYLKIRDKLKSGDIIVACKGNMKSVKGFLSLLVRVVTASSYSHVGIVLKLGNRCFVVEATPPVVRLYPLSKLESFYVIKMDRSLSREDENRLFDYVGLPYSDWNSIASYCTGRPVVNGKLQCAQLVSSFYNWPNLLRPEQIVRYAQEDLGKRMVFVR